MNKKERKLIISFLFTGLIISLIIISYRNNWFSNETNLTTVELENPGVDKIIINEKKIKIQPISNEDHILGNPNASIKIITYSDFECPFCADLFFNMDQVLELYGMTGKIAWIYRHFPINQVEGSTSIQLSLASECLSYKQPDNYSSNIFWGFARKVFIAESDVTKPTVIEDILSELDFSRKDYDECMDGKLLEEKILLDIEDGLTLANQYPDFGTPFNIIYFPNGDHQIISGAIEYQQIKAIIDSVN